MRTPSTLFSGRGPTPSGLRVVLVGRLRVSGRHASLPEASRHRQHLILGVSTDRYRAFAAVEIIGAEREIGLGLSEVGQHVYERTTQASRGRPTRRSPRVCL